MNKLKEILWAKTDPFESIYSHSEKTTIVMGILMSDYFAQDTEIIAKGLGISVDEAIRLSEYIAAVHDIGKMVPVWQSGEFAPTDAKLFFEQNKGYTDQDEEALYHQAIPGVRYRYRHECGGTMILERIWKDAGFWNYHLIRQFAYIVLVHHQKKHDAKTDMVIGTTKKKCTTGIIEKIDEWILCQEELERNYRNRYDIDKISIKAVSVDCSCEIMSGLLILSDWIASSLYEISCCSERDYFVFKTIAEETVKEIGFNTKHNIDISSFTRMWPWISDESIRPIQRETEKIANNMRPLLSIIEAPMGEGKTEAGLYLAEVMRKAYNKEGIYIALPTSATANQMHSRVNTLLDRFNMNGSRLIHGTAWMYQNKKSGNDPSAFLAPSRMGLLSSYGVGTIDQVLMSVLKTKYCNIRMTGLAGKVLLLDEVHAYDAYMSKEIIALLQWCKELEVPVVMLSATLPRKKRNDFLSIYSEKRMTKQSYPMISLAYNDCTTEYKTVEGAHQHNVYRITIETIMHDIKGIADNALDIVKNGGCLCIAVNTVARSIDIAKELEVRKTDVEIHIFHSRYTKARRKEIEEECIHIFGKDDNYASRPHKAILVATQVVEQSLDIDFDFYMTDICPIDLFFQRIGRLFRHMETPRPQGVKTPQVVILTPDTEGYREAEVVYFRFYLDRTMKLLSGVSSISIPDDIQKYVDIVYDEEPSEKELDAYIEKEVETTVENDSAANVLFEAPKENSFQFGEFIKNNAEEPVDEDTASTRFGNDSETIAILPEDLLKKVLAKDVTKNNLLEAFKYSISIRLDILNKEFNLDKGELGKGPLYGIWLFPGREKKYLPCDEHHVEGQNGTIKVSREYGLEV